MYTATIFFGWPDAARLRLILSSKAEFTAKTGNSGGPGNIIVLQNNPAPALAGSTPTLPIRFAAAP
jgi:hypothetical protein